MTSRFPEFLRIRILELLNRFPDNKAALLPALHLVQNEHGFIGPEEEAAVADLLAIRPIEVREAVTFYSMFRRRPAGRRLLQVCTNLTCTIRGGDRILDHLRKTLGIEPGGTTPDGRFTLIEVECQGACDQAPCLMIGETLHGGLTPESVDELLRGLE
jgi:NADH-quinone oxidoreductase subunit E